MRRRPLRPLQVHRPELAQAQLAFLRAPLVITLTMAAWNDGALVERTLGALRASAAGGGRAALKQLGYRLVELGTALIQESSAEELHGTDEGGSSPGPHLV